MLHAHRLNGESRSARSDHINGPGRSFEGGACVHSRHHAHEEDGVPRNRSILEYAEVLERLQSLANPEWVSGMGRFGIETRRAYGIRVPDLRKLARETGKNHLLAQQLWATEIHEARILASMIADPKQMTEELMDGWAADLDSWDLCDGCCGNLFDKTEFAYKKVEEWSLRPEEFVKRAAFALMAWLAVHDKDAQDEAFLPFLPVIERECTDDRNFVKKAVNWALREIGKRDLGLNAAAIDTASAIRRIDSRSARWIASDALRELTSEKVQSRLRR